MPGTRFTIFGADVHLEFQKGKTRDQVNWLSTWIANYLLPLAEQEERAAAAAAEASGEVAAPELPGKEKKEPEPGQEAFIGQKPITSFPFIKEANGSDKGGFKEEDYVNNE